MTTQLTPGRWLGLKRTSAPNDVFTILAFDQRGTYKRMLPEGTSFDRAVQIKSEIVSALSQKASAVLLDEEYGLRPALEMSRHSGLLLSYEKSGYSGDATYRKIQFNPDWTLTKIKKMGGTAVKVLTYYNPENQTLADEIDGVITQVAADCHAQDLPLFLEPLSYSMNAAVVKESAEFAPLRPTAVVETARRLSRTGADILKMEFPLDVAYNSDRSAWRTYCEAVSEASTVPWVLLSAGVDFETFAEQTQIACEAGASGFLAGRAIWKEAVTMGDAERAAFLQQTALPRLERLSEIAVKYARPWTQWYSAPTASQGWYTSY
jgi:tagatose 1,6-diphosphate aldolase